MKVFTFIKLYKMCRMVGGIMKYKKQIMLVSFIIFIIIGTFAFEGLKKTSKTNGVELSFSELTQPNFLNQQLAVLYASSTTDVLQKGKGNSKAIFINQKGELHALKLSGLESGSTYFNKKVLFIEDSKKVIMLGNSVENYDMPTEELRGIRTGYLSKTRQFYSLYNTGFSKKDDYITTIRYGGEEKIQSAHIPFFISTVGQLSDRLIIVTQDLITGEFALRQVQLKSKVLNKKLIDLHLENAGELDAITPVVADNHNLYFVMTHYQSEKSEDLYLVIVNRSTKKVKTIPFIQYRSEDEVENGLPFNFNNSAYIKNGHFFYVNGLGEVYDYQVTSGDIKKIVQLSREDKGNSRLEQITFKNNKIYHIYSDEDQQFFLETFDLFSRVKEKTIEIKHLKSILPMDDQNYYLSSLEILQ